MRPPGPTFPSMGEVGARAPGGGGPIMRDNRCRDARAMKLQKATLFALLAVLELARAPDRQMSAAEIAERHGISVNHLAKVLRDLGRAGLVEAVRGVGGGYRFSGNAKRTSLYDVIHMFGDIAEDYAAKTGKVDGSDIAQALQRVMREVDEIAVATLKSISLATLIKSLDWPQTRFAGLEEEQAPPRQARA